VQAANTVVIIKAKQRDAADFMVSPRTNRVRLMDTMNDGSELTGLLYFPGIDVYRTSNAECILMEITVP
jgi:hypothetical protein